MHASFILMTVLCFILLALVVVGGTAILGIRTIKGGVSRNGQRLHAEEAKILQEIYQNLTKMEERVEVLETILLDSEKRTFKNESK